MSSSLLSRQKVLLSFLALLERSCTKLFLLKNMFLLCEEELHKNIYDFYPYQRGPFSQVLYADLRSLQQRGYLQESKNDLLLTQNVHELVEEMDSDILYALANVIRQYGKIKDNVLLEQVYHRHPYYAIRNPLHKGKYTKYDPKHDPKLQKATIFSIGYEGKTVDAFLNRLIQNNVHVLVDIRNNPRSMKFGFSFPKLADYCTASGIEYKGMPQLGIESHLRQELNTDEDYKKLFDTYEKTTLANQDAAIDELADMLKAGKRIALLCFEADVCHCHRSRTSAKLASRCRNTYELVHL